MGKVRKNSNKKVKTKDEKNVNPGEEDVIFERIKMKKSIQEEKKKKDTMKTENISNLEEEITVKDLENF